MRIVALSFIALLVSTPGLAQKPKKTINHEKFAKKIQFALTPELVGKWQPDATAIKYVSDKTGTSVDDLNKKNVENLIKIKEDVNVITESGIYGAIGEIELTNVKEHPIKTADIIVNYKNKVGDYQFIYTNCVQTNLSWYLGDGIQLAGDGVKDIIAAREAKKAKVENGFLGKLSEIDAKQNAMLEESKKLEAENKAKRDDLNALRKGHIATTFPVDGLDKSSKYYKHDLTNMPLEGYYVTLKGELVSAVIAYQKPEFLVGDFAASSSLFICKEVTSKEVDLWNPDNESNFKEYVSKDQTQAFYVGDQLFSNIKNEGWRIVTSEGAIHTFVKMVKVTSNGKTSYQTFEQTQKLDGTAYGSIFGGASTNVLLDFMEDCPEIAQKLKDGTYSKFEAIVRYNYWYDLTYPDRVKYLPAPQG